MNQAKRAFAVFVILSLVLIFSLYIVYKNKPKYNQDEILFFYGITCPHCKNVENFIDENNLNDKLKIRSFEVYQNETNLNEMLAYARKCGLKDSNLGVPMIYYNGKCYIGDKDCIDLLKNLAGSK
ncbi:MAG: glutaredoxin domain-containing protein [Candidatus Aenigmatarchaeota archaeon]|nr:hypothetical protein [Candidatus Aenigmarchaeota archaeon]